jgi:hypothetical protein
VSTVSDWRTERLPEDAERRGGLVAEAKYPERWFGTGDLGDNSTEDASVSVTREPCEDDRERDVEALWSDSSAECVEEDDGVFREAISGAL